MPLLFAAKLACYLRAFLGGPPCADKPRLGLIVGGIDCPTDKVFLPALAERFAITQILDADTDGMTQAEFEASYDALAMSASVSKSTTAFLVSPRRASRRRRCKA